LEHVLHEINRAVARGLGPNLAAAELHPLAGEHANKAVFDTLVLAEQEPDFACANADIAGRHVGILTDMPV
jgi:hypothetical protein